MFAGFEVAFDVKPDVTEGTYALVGAGATAFEAHGMLGGEGLDIGEVVSREGLQSGGGRRCFHW